MKDHYAKQPTKLEREIDYQFRQVYEYINQINVGATALARKTLKPEELAKLIFEGTENAIYMRAVQEALKELDEKSKAPVSEETKAAIEKASLTKDK